MYYPHAAAADSAGNIYIADDGNGRIRKVTISTGIITTFAGTGSHSYSGDGGAATSATMQYPYDITLDSAGTFSINTFVLVIINIRPTTDNVYIADTYNARIRKVTAGIITTIAGKSGNGYSGDGVAATSTTLYSPWGLSVDSSGILHFISSLCAILSYSLQGTCTSLTR